jgi:hypothetical protein
VAFHAVFLLLLPTVAPAEPPAGRLVLWHFPTLPTLRFCHLFCGQHFLTPYTQEIARQTANPHKSKKQENHKKEPILIHSTRYAHSVRHFLKTVVLKSLLFPFVSQRTGSPCYFPNAHETLSLTKKPPKTPALPLQCHKTYSGGTTCRPSFASPYGRSSRACGSKVKREP